ncbi:MAG: hypothetical protein Q9167_005268 [Letrouitia subvulpina]
MFERGNQRFRPPSSNDMSWSNSASSKCKSCGGRYSLPCILALLPRYEVCEKLCGIFFSTVFPLMPVLHLLDFTHNFRTFWEETGRVTGHDTNISSLLRRKPSFICLLSSILFASLATASPSRVADIKDIDDDQSATPDKMYFMAMVTATLTGFPRRPSLDTLAAYLIAQSQFVREEDFADAPDFISTAFRVALGMGLHRQLPHAGFSVAELETRRRLWWYILHLDIMSSASSGLSPLFIDDKMANAEMISQYDQRDGNSEDRSNQIDVRYFVASKRYDVTKRIRGIIRSHFEDAFKSPEQVRDVAKELQEMTVHINTTVERLLERGSPSSANTVPSSKNEVGSIRSSTLSPKFDRVWKIDSEATDREVAGYCSWSALLLHLMVHKAFGVLYHPIFRDPVMTSDVQLRASAVKHAQAFLQIFMRVCDDPVSEPFHWMYPGTYQPLQAVALLLADLLQRPWSDEAQLSRGLVDAVFEIYHVDQGMVCRNEPPKRNLSPSGKEAWSMLARTRKRALERIGQDSHVFFPQRLATSEFCICGERVSGQNSPRDNSDAESRTQSPRGPWRDEFATTLNSDTLGEEEQRSTASQDDLIGTNNFDWLEWDSSVGPSMGLMS